MRILLPFLFLGVGLSAYAASTTYTFTSQSWASKVGTITCDNHTDGWKNTDEGSTFTTGQGVTIYASGDGTGEAISYIQWEHIRQVVVSYSTNASKGAGEVTISIGDDDTTMVQSVTSEGGTQVRNLVFMCQREYSGRITLGVRCTQNSIHIQGITVKADNCSPAVFSNSTYHLVTDMKQLGDSAWVMFGIADGKTNKVMGYFDESVSQNNIHAISAKYDANREYVNGNEEVTYLLRKAVSEGKKQTSYTIYDPYWEAYLVASGGRTKNALRIWNKPYDKDTYGDYGYWDIEVDATGKATVMSLGNSLGKYMQYNSSFDLFGCYQALQMTDVAIYMQEDAQDLTQTIILVPLIGFGTQVLRSEMDTLYGSKKVEIKTNRLQSDLSASLLHGEVFALDTNRIDRDGDYLTVSFKVSQPGSYLDTLVLSNADTTLYVNVTLKVARELTLAEASHVEEAEYVYLNPLVVTKKYDKYVYVRDSTGAMLLIDEGPTTDHYAKGLEKGCVIRQVEGRFQNYWGVPEVHMAAKPSVDAQKVECLPISVTDIDSADVCQYVQFDSILYADFPTISEKFTLPQTSISLAAIEAAEQAGWYHYYRLEGIVSYDWNKVVLAPTFIEQRTDGTAYETPISMDSSRPMKILLHGHIFIIYNGRTYNL